MSRTTISQRVSDLESKFSEILQQIQQLKNNMPPCDNKGQPCCCTKNNDAIHKLELDVSYLHGTIDGMGDIVDRIDDRIEVLKYKLREHE